MSNTNKVSLVIVVNGDETEVEANLNAPLHTVAQHALNDSGNQGRPLSDWEFKNEAGQLLDLNRKVGDFGFAPGTVLYLTLLVGVNGAVRQAR
jgi:hypothetical protein